MGAVSAQIHTSDRAKWDARRIAVIILLVLLFAFSYIIVHFFLI